MTGTAETSPSAAPPAKTPEAETAAGPAPAGYRVRIDHDMFTQDPALDDMLARAGFTEAQVQLVYDLALEKLLPVAREIARSHRADLEIRQLEACFGGPEKWRTASRQIRDWARAHLQPETYEALADSSDGILAMYRMMTGDGEPALMHGGAVPPESDERELRKLIRSPRYWRERDPATVRRVAEGFGRIYPRG